MNYIRLHPQDNVIVAIVNISQGTELEGVQTLSQIDRGHKMATTNIKKGEVVRKYGQMIGVATTDIKAGEHVHTHNLTYQEPNQVCEFAVEKPQKPSIPEWAKNRTFKGYIREDGRVGTRNYILIASTVNCSATVVKRIAKEVQTLLKDYPNIDGVLPITHKTGCGISHDSAQHKQFARTISGYVKHPNVSKCLLIGLGCEVGGIEYLAENKDFVPEAKLRPSLKSSIAQNSTNKSRIEAYTLQDVGGTKEAISMGVEIIKKWLPEINALKREEVPISKLILGTNCGGSDGYSGLTANPIVGDIVDILAVEGGTGVLAETPETFGAHYLLAKRSINEEVGKKLVSKIDWWKEYTAKFGETCDGNPSSGNKKGGLTTILEKSLGAATKGGTTTLNAVYDYSEKIEMGKGFVFMDTPGHDPDSVTGIIAGGANVVVFTTGRGSCFGSKPAPTIKVATNTQMYSRMLDDMDINAGCILEGTPREAVAKELFEKIISVANGKLSLSEQNGYGDEEFAPWNIGPTF